MIRSILLTCVLVTGNIVTPASAAEWVKVSWDAYHGATPIARIIVERSENGGTWRQIASLWESSTTQIIDRNTKRRRNYCYRGRTVTAGGTFSPYSNQACARMR
jgi:hypothetical protein